MVADLEEDPLEGFAALARGLIRKLVEEIEGAVAAERAGTEGPHVRLTVLDGDGRQAVMDGLSGQPEVVRWLHGHRSRSRSATLLTHGHRVKQRDTPTCRGG
jgi:hypothetical protein